MKFDINNYTDIYYAMYCKTEDETRAFCNYLHSIGRAWCSGRSYLGETNFVHYEDDNLKIVYYFNNGTFSNVRTAKKKGYIVLNFSDFEW